MGGLGLVLAWALAVAPAWWVASGSLALGPIACTALALAPWIFLLGLPRAAVSRDVRRATLPAVLAGTLALAAPPLALAAGLDRARGGDSLALLGYGLAMAAMVAWAAHSSRAGRVRSLAYGIVWVAMVVAVPLLSAILAWDGAPGGRVPRGLITLASASPFDWLYRCAGSDAPAPPWAPMVGCGVLCLVARLRPESARSARATLAVVAIGLLVAAQPVQGNRLRFGSVVLAGPLEHAALTTEDGSRTCIDGVLRAGERRVLRAPFAAGRTSPAREPQVVDGGAGVVFESWEPDSPGPLAALPGALRARVRPPVAAGEVRVPLPVWAILVGAFWAGLGLRRKPYVALVVGLAGALGTSWLLARLARPTGAPVRVLEGLASGVPWLRVDAGTGELRLSEGSERLETEPAWAPLEFAVTLGGDAGERVSARAPEGTALYALAALEPGERAFEARGNTWGALVESWVRSPSGEWSAHGRWARGTPLPAPAAAGTAPPGWLASGLPQGTGVLIGRLAPGSFGEGDGPTWVRSSGF